MQLDFGEPQKDLMRRTIARGATEDELDLFIEQCRRTGLDPFARQIYAVRRKQWNAQSRTYEEAQVIQLSIDGFRLIADRTQQYAGQVGPWWCGGDAEWREVWLEEAPPSAAKIGVLRHDFAQPLYAIALYKSYVQTNSHGDPVSRWKDDPAGMLAKCAESLALRRAFPQNLSGLYTADEMGKVNSLAAAAAGAAETETESIEDVPAPAPRASLRPYSARDLPAVFARAVAAIEAKGLMLGPDDYTITEQALDELTGNDTGQALYLNYLTGGIPFLEDLNEADIVALLRLLKPTLVDGSYVACQEAHQEFELVRQAAELEAHIHAAEVGLLDSLGAVADQISGALPEPMPAVVDDASEPEPEPEPEPAPAKKASRPYAPETLPGKIKETARKLAKANPDLTITPEERALVKQLLETAVGPEAALHNQAPSAARGHLQFYLTGIRSLDEMPAPTVAALRAWLKPSQADGGEWIVDPMAEREATSAYLYRAPVGFTPRNEAAPRSEASHE